MWEKLRPELKTGDEQMGWENSGSFDKFLKSDVYKVPCSPEKFPNRVKCAIPSLYRDTNVKRLLSALDIFLVKVAGGESHVKDLLLCYLNRQSNKSLKDDLIQSFCKEPQKVTDNLISNFAKDIAHIDNKSSLLEQGYKSRVCAIFSCSGVSSSILQKSFMASCKRFRRLEEKPIEIGSPFTTAKRGRKRVEDTHPHVKKKLIEVLQSPENSAPQPKRTVKNAQTGETLCVQELSRPKSHIYAMSGLQKPSVRGGSKSSHHQLSRSSLDKLTPKEFKSVRPEQMKCGSCKDRLEKIILSKP